jgi:dipeptidyl aminopeptidase/acylaminoacyl peptidase
VIGQFPDFFSAAVIRNPVISCGEISSTDIPDWYLEEFGMSFEETTILTPEVFARLYRVSPISHVDSVRAPVLLLLGSEDKRVANTQGMNYYHALKGRRKDVEMLCFPKDSHPLDGVEAAKVGWEAARDWLDAFSGSGPSK